MLYHMLCAHNYDTARKDKIETLYMENGDHSQAKVVRWSRPLTRVFDPAPQLLT